MILPASGKPTYNESLETNDQRPLDHRAINGLLVNRTLTLAGRTFYDSFAIAWQELDTDGRFSLSISERSTAHQGSRVFVDYGNRRLFQAFLPPGHTRASPLAVQAAEQVYHAILDHQVTQFFGDPDLARDEL